MANYNTFIVVNCNTRKSVLTTSSARKADRLLDTGFRVEVWNNNCLIETIRAADKRKEAHPLAPYIELERDYIRQKQKRAEERNKRRRARLHGKAAEGNRQKTV